jgi:hypothetical protein
MLVVELLEQTVHDTESVDGAEDPLRFDGPAVGVGFQA